MAAFDRVGDKPKFMVMNNNLGGLDQLLIPLLGDLYGWVKSFIQNIIKPGMYEVLNYETTLEILDAKGMHAILTKIEEVKFLQNNIIAFQDQAWGDGEILVNYQCSPGKAVDFFRNGHKTLILISLPYMKQRGEYITFRINWKIKNGFIKPTGFWGTDIDHQTQKIKISLILPAVRPPKRIFIEETSKNRSQELDMTNLSRLPDNRWQIFWEKQNPRLHEHYLLRWEW